MRNSNNSIIFAAGLPYICLVLAFSSCTATTGTKIPAGEYQLSKTKRIGILTTKEEEFSLRILRERMTGTGVLLGGLVGLGIESGIRSSSDTKLEDELKPLLRDFDPTSVLTDKLAHRMQSASPLKKVLPLKSKDEGLSNNNGLDSLLEVTLKQWGLRLCAAPTSLEQVEVALTVHGKVTIVDNGNSVWERNEVYREGSCHPLSKFQSQDGALEQALTAAIDNLAGKMVNDILFP
jgi:hypothetical protein